MTPEILLEVDDLHVSYHRGSSIRRPRVHAVNGVSLRVRVGETFALVGESGSGKTTTGRVVAGLVKPTSGSVRFDGEEIAGLRGQEYRQYRKSVQMIFQDAYASLNPRQIIAAIIGQPLRRYRSISRAQAERESAELMRSVGLAARYLRYYPRELSGGQRQRVVIARALALEPRLIICDEPISSLDLSTQSQVINLFRDLQDERGVSYLFISHDLSVVRHLATDIGVMYLGRLMESGPAAAVYGNPLHPYTQALLAAVPIPDVAEQRKRRLIRQQLRINTEPASALHPPDGCVYHPRCAYALPQCAEQVPDTLPVAEGGTVSCHLHDPHATGPSRLLSTLDDLRATAARAGRGTRATSSPPHPL